MLRSLNCGIYIPNEWGFVVVFFLPTVLRSILQITLTTAFHQTLQLLLALLHLSQVWYRKPTASWVSAYRTVSPLRFLCCWGKLTPSKNSKQSVSEQTNRKGWERQTRPCDGEVIYIQNFSWKFHAFRMYRHLGNLLLKLFFAKDIQQNNILQQKSQWENQFTSSGIEIQIM